jgi:early secretory antigenic target protein ESAT-6
MAYNTLRIDTDAMRSVNADMATQNAQITEALSTLQSGLESQMTGWSGSAKNQYDEYKATWNRAAANMNQILQALARNTATMADNYEEAESANTRMWN